MALNSNFRTLTADNMEGVVSTRNYLKNSFENGSLTGWTELSVALTSGLPTGTPTISAAAASSLTLSVTSTTPLSLDKSLLVSVPSALTAGQGFISDAFTLDRMDLGKVITVSFDYERISGTYNFSGTLGSQTWMVYVYDVTAGGANWIQPAGFLGMNQSSSAGRVACTFQSSVVAGQQYRIAVIASQAAAGASSIEFDNFSCSRQTAPIGPVVTDTLNAGAITIGATVTAPTKGTRTADSVSWMRIGDSAYFSYQYNQTGAGAAGSGDYLISLPSGMSFDSNKVSFYTGGLVNFSALVPYGLPDAWFGWGQSPGTNSYGLIIPYDSTRFRVAFEYVSASGPVATGGLFWGSGGNQLSFATVSFNATFQVPISGWSSNVQLSNDTDTRVVAARMFRTATQAIGSTAFTKVLINSSSIDTHAAFDSANNLYRIPVSGFYRVTGCIYGSAITSSFIQTRLTRNGTAFSEAFQISGAGGDALAITSDIVQCNAGDTIELYVASGDSSYTVQNSSTTTYLSIERLSGPSVVAASETVAAGYWGNSAQSIPVGVDSVCVSTPSKVYDTHNMWAAGTGYNSGTGTWTTRPGFTIPVSGKYLITFSCGVSLPGSSTLGTLWSEVGHLRGASVVSTLAGNRLAGSFQDTFSSSGSGILNCQAGDFVGLFTFQSTGAARNTNTEPRHTRIEIVRVGN